MIDFSMSGINMALISGLLLFLEGLCLLILLHPIKRFKHFTAREYILLSIALLVMVGGLICFIVGLAQAIPSMKM